MFEKDDDHVLLRKPKHPITVKNVLTHTSGLPFKSGIEEPTPGPLSPVRPGPQLRHDAPRLRARQQVPVQQRPVSTRPLGIIEVVSGQPYEEFLSQRLFRPLGMNDTTFWPTEEQVARIAKSYKPGPGKKGLEETTISQLYYPLSDRVHRFPMPAGGLFATAHDVARYYQMLLSGGELDGRRCLSEEAVRQMTSRQTPANLPDSYGFGLSVSDTTFGHGGAYSTNTLADTRCGLIRVWLVQHAGFPGDGAKAQGVFMNAAIKAYRQQGEQ